MIKKNHFDINNSKTIETYGVPLGFEGQVINNISIINQKNIIYLAKDDKDAEIIKTSILFFNSKIKIFNFPAWDCLPYDRTGPRLEIQSKRLELLAKFSDYDDVNKVIIITINAISQKVIPREHLKNLIFELNVGKSYNIEKLRRFLIYSGYIETGKVLELGDFSVRGGIVDIFSSSFENPIRLDFFGDYLENIRCFSIEDQKSNKHFIDKVTIYAVREVCLSKINIDLFKKNYLKNFGIPDKNDHLYHSIISGQIFPGYEHWIPFFYEKMETIFDYIHDPILIIPSHFKNSYKIRSDNINEFFKTRKDIKLQN